MSIRKPSAAHTQGQGRTMRLLPFLLLLAPAPALAQEGDRYQLERTEDGYVRLDTRTGEMSSCREEAVEEGADRLRADLEALERRVTALEESKGSGGLPSDEELDRTLGFMEKFFRTFMGLAREWSEDEPAPERTAL
jgi:hypothetical protein